MENTGTNNQSNSKKPGFFTKIVSGTKAHIANNRAKYGVALGALLGLGGSAAVSMYQNRRS